MSRPKIGCSEWVSHFSFSFSIQKNLKTKLFFIWFKIFNEELSCMLHTFWGHIKNLLKCGDKKIVSKNPQLWLKWLGNIFNVPRLQMWWSSFEISCLRTKNTYIWGCILLGINNGSKFFLQKTTSLINKKRASFKINLRFFVYLEYCNVWCILLGPNEKWNQFLFYKLQKITFFQIHNYNFK